MKIESIAISNFRCFGAGPSTVTLEDGITALVGNNGSGKTAFLSALSRMFGVTNAQRQVTHRDFHLGPNDQELSSGAMLSIDVVLAFPELSEKEGEENQAVMTVPDFFLHMSATGVGEPLKARMRLQAIWTEDGTPEGTVEEDIRWIPTLKADFDWEKCKKVTPIERVVIQLVYVPATRNVAEQVTNLLKGRLWRAARWSEGFCDEIAAGSSAIQQFFEGEKPTKFIAERLERRWRQVHEADTDTKPLLRLVEGRLEDLVRRAEFAFFPDEAGQPRDIRDLSDGQRSLFHIALTAATLEIERDVLGLDPGKCAFDQEKLRRTYLTVLAIEEPENSLSPFFLSRIVILAREVGALTSAQVIVSSHSASILSRIEADEVRYFRLDRKARLSSVRCITLPDNDTEARQYVRLAVKAYPELYFARFVILAEGDSERIVLPRIAEAMGLYLDPSFVPVVPLGGRYVSHFWRLLTDLEIPHASFLDLDLGRQHGGANSIRSAVEALAEIGNDLSLNRWVIAGVIEPEEVYDLENKDLVDGFEKNPWMQALKDEGVYFSDPIDLDFSMLLAFPTAYRHPNEGGHGPRMDVASIQEKKRVTLKTGGSPELFDDSFDDDFAWYPYLFLSHSKPERHLSALSRIDQNKLAKNSPPEIRALVEHVKSTLGLEVDGR